ncbi:MAG: hypothetical protein HPY45_05475 [Anaerolineae bacterium]|nr:hypothetical protein [Anaerolineae bacterium]
MKRLPNHPASKNSDPLERFLGLLSAAEQHALREELQRPLRSGLRINPLKTDAHTLQRWAQRYGWMLQPAPFCEDGWWVEKSDTPPSQVMPHRLGFYYLQDVASMLPVSLFEFPSQGEPLVLDMAASPGGKTTHIISRTHDRGLVVANDSSTDRITALKLVLQNWGGVNVGVTRFAGENFGVWFPEVFDFVLLDAPCSMQSLRSTEAHPARPISEKEQGALSLRQFRLLVSALQAVRVGGQVVYATCTLSPEEDEAVLDQAFSAFGTCVQVEDVSSRLPRPAPALISDGVRSFAAPVQNALRLWPHLYRTSGFFAALLTKTASLPVARQSAPSRPFEKTGLLPLKRHEVRNLMGYLEDAYGFALLSVIEQLALSLWRRGEEVFLLPEQWLSSFSQLPYQMLGMNLGKEMPEGFSPSHEWVARYGMAFQSGRVVLNEKEAIAWANGADIGRSFLDCIPKGRTVAVLDVHGDLLGRGKVLADRLKNLLPRRLAF